MADVRLKLLSPWAICIKKVEALFDGDPQIACNVNYGGSEPFITLACNNGDKLLLFSRFFQKKLTLAELN